MATTSNKLVYVHWVDACSQDEWTHLGSITPTILDTYTVGYLVAENKEGLSVASTINEANDACCIINIPKRWIKTKGTLHIETKQRKSKGQNVPAVGEGSDNCEVQTGE